MKYNGIELEEMTPEKWDGKSREMLVWDNNSKNPWRKIIIGYFPGNLTGWMPADCSCSWQHCAEIPKKESIEDLKEQVERLKADNKNLCNLFNDISAEYEKFLEENKELKEKIKSENKPKKKLRRMTYKELSEWLAKGNGQYKDGNFGSFRTELVYCKNEENTIVDNDCLIRGWNEAEWHEPLIEE